MILLYEGKTAQQESTEMMSLMYGLAMFFLFAEAGCYFLVYKYLYTHDNSMLRHSIISMDAYKNRQRTNIFSMGGQCCCFLAELLFVATMMIWINVVESYYVTSLKEVYFVVKIGEFGISSTIQVLASKEFRTMFLKTAAKTNISLW
jgi:hypothetical protein